MLNQVHSTFLHLPGNELVKLKQTLPEAGIGNEVVTHWRCLSFFLVENRKQPPWKTFKFSEGVFY
jgi:hypothetical protein